MPNSEEFYDQITTSSFSLARFVMHCIWTITKLSRSHTLGNYNSYLLLLTEFSPQQQGNLLKGNDNKTVRSRARPDWAYEFPDQTGPDTQICRTGPSRPDFYIFKHFSM